MHKYIIEDTHSRYTRISKIQARGLFYANPELDNLVACSNNVRPGFPFAMHVPISPLHDNREFDQIVNSFEYYNCTKSSEYASFYLVTERGNHENTDNEYSKER